MTERLALGITVGALHSVAIAAAGESGDVDPRAGGAVRVLPTARAAGVPDSPSVTAGFLDRVGDPVDMLDEYGNSCAAADLVTTAIDSLIADASAATDRTPDAVVVCHPARWSEHMVRAQRAALAAAGLSEVTTVPEQSAAVRWLEHAHGRLDTGAVVVYDLGATGLTVSVVRTGAQAGPLGVPSRTTDIAGAEFDLLTMRYVLANALNGNDFDPFDPVIERELSDLRERCRMAKEELSDVTATVVPVRLDPAGPQQRIRLVRDELEDLLRGSLLTSLDLIRDAVHRAGLAIPDVSRILVTGGGAAIPLVTELLSTEFGLPVVASVHPERTAAHGAALLAGDLSSATVASAPPAALTKLAPARVSPPDPARPAPEFTALDLPSEPPPRRTSKQRTIVIAGAALAIILLTCGSVAIGTGVVPTTHPPSQESATTAFPDPSGEVSTPAQPVAATNPDGTPVGPTAAGSPGSPVVAVAGTTAAATPGANTPEQQGQPAQNQGQPAQGQPEGQPAQPQPGQPAQPAPPANTPAPTVPQQPQPTQQSPAQSPTTLFPVPKPQAPSLPTGALEDTIDGVGGAVGTVLRAPGEILGGNGG
ncbi:Hsp70 family protein [Nocardia takedensis]|uniref:Hsp70 family protein n=1 Tax=Nocardia takedensis TaxID=259390 RepID=UPI0002E2073D|nr:Hsp70 family protein [Nocardia takedensis]